MHHSPAAGWARTHNTPFAPLAAPRIGLAPFVLPDPKHKNCNLKPAICVCKFSGWEIQAPGRPTADATPRATITRTPSP